MLPIFDHLRDENRALRAEVARLQKEVAELLDALSLPCPTCGDIPDRRENSLCDTSDS